MKQFSKCHTSRRPLVETLNFHEGHHHMQSRWRARKRGGGRHVRKQPLQKAPWWRMDINLANLKEIVDSAGSVVWHSKRSERDHFPVTEEALIWKPPLMSPRCSAISKFKRCVAFSGCWWRKKARADKDEQEAEVGEIAQICLLIVLCIHYGSFWRPDPWHLLLGWVLPRTKEPGDWGDCPEKQEHETGW